MFHAALYGCINFATKEVANINLTLKFHLFDPLFNYEQPGLYHVLNLGVNQPLRVAFFVHFFARGEKGQEWNVTTLIWRGSNFCFIEALNCSRLGFNALLASPR